MTTTRRPPRRLIAALAIGGVALLAGILLFWQTPHGTVRIEINDDKMTAEIDSNGVVIKRSNEMPIELKPGEHGLLIRRGDFEFETDKFVLNKGEEVTLKIELMDGKVHVSRNGHAFEERSLPAVADQKRETAAPKAYALSFEGKQALVNLPTLERNSAGPCTLEAWIRKAGNDTELLIKLGGKAHCQLFVHTDALMGLETDIKNETRRLVIGAKPADRSKWTHVAYVLDESEGRLFVDGKLAGRAAGPFAEAGEPARRQGASIGAEYPERFSYFPGDMREVRISTTARYNQDFIPAQRFAPDADTLALYHCDEGSGDVLTDSSGNGHDGKIEGAKWIKTDGGPIDLKSKISDSQ